MSEDDVNITKNKKLLEDIRGNNGNETIFTTVSPGFGIRHAESGNNVDRQDSGGTVSSSQGAGGSTQGVGASNGASQRLRAGTGSANGASVNPAPRPSRSNRKSQQPVVTPAEPPAQRLRIPFLEKKQTVKTPVKLFSADEAEHAHEKMTFIYKKIFEFGDDFLEIIVKDHEEVQIWAITDEQAETLAENHLADAQHDQEAARSARKLLEIYARLYFYGIMFPRIAKTGQHVAEHKGLSFK